MLETFRERQHVYEILQNAGFTVALVVAFWEHYPIVVMLVLVAIYLSAAALIYARLVQLQKEWHTLPATMEQLKKDRECLGQILT